ncbi:MAG: NAD(+) diphosphatase [Pseudomonadota bacterium]
MPVPFLHADYTPVETSADLSFGGNRLDRLSEDRSDDAVEAALASADTRIMAFARGRVLIAFEDDAPVGLHTLDALQPFSPHRDRGVLLGFEDGAARLAIPLAINPDDEDFTLPEPYKAVDYRSLARQQILDAEGLGMAAQGAAVLAWHASARFCGRCGSAMEMRAGGAKRHCPSCQRDQFPRTDPVVIMLTTHGDRCLLGRSHHFPPGMYSALAGFVEPGESIEMAVRRETHEEAGIHIGDVTYHATQPWPFPHTLMIGCYGQALDDTIRKDETELDDCRWFDKAMIRELMADGGPLNPDGTPQFFLPPKLAIANRLVADWAAKD